MLWTEPLVICGFGEVGERVAASAVASGVLPHRISVIDRDRERLGRAAGCGYRTVAGDPAFSDAIRSLGDAAASKVVICLGDELAAEAVGAVRRVSPRACVQVVLETSDAENAVARAGADLVLPLSRLAGRLLAASAMSGAVAIGAPGSG
jgi:voltage-gated potassium channel Kch